MTSALGRDTGGGDPQYRPMIELTIDHAAIAHNIRVIRQQGTAELMAVIKADGFNHGVLEVATTAIRAGASWIGVATVEEAVQVRELGIVDAPVLCWLVDPWSRLQRALELGVTLSIANVPTLEAVADAAAAVGARPAIHLQLDTGMARGGSDVQDWAALLRRAAEYEAAGVLSVEGVWSHLAKASNPDPEAVASQRDALERGIQEARAHGLNPSVFHLANSAAALAHGAAHLDVVRVGASLYGIEAVSGQRYGLRQALRLTSRITQLHQVPAGSGVGYDHHYLAPSATRIAVVPIGYADGVPRRFEGQISVSIRGARFPVVGVISMDQITVDVGEAEVELGDEVVLLGEADRGEPEVAEWARLGGTVDQEILTGIGGRVIRRHLNFEGQA